MDLGGVNGHDFERHPTRDGRVQLAASTQGQLPIPSSFQTHEDVQQCAQQHILLDNVGLKSEACPTATDVEVIVAIQTVRSLEHVKISARVNHDEKDQKHDTSDQSRSVVGNLEVPRRKYRVTALVDEAQ